MSVITSPPKPSPATESVELGENDYRSVSVYAVLALIVALSTLAMVVLSRSPIAAMIAFAGIGFGYFGVRQTVRQPDIYSGRGLALFSFLLSVVIAAWGVAHGISHEDLRQKQAIEFCEHFFFCLTNDHLDEAHQFHDERFDGKDRKSSLQAYYRDNPDIAKSRDGLLQMQPLDAIYALSKEGKQIKFRLLSIAKERGQPKTENYRCIWLCEATDGDGKHPLYIYASLQVEYNPKPATDVPRWRLSQIVIAPIDERGH